MTEEMKAVRRRARQDVELARAEGNNAVKTFSYGLWERIGINFTEVMEPMDFNRFPLPERVLLRKLRRVLDELRDLGIAPQEER